jgi:hypothetical protein
MVGNTRIRRYEDQEREKRTDFDGRTTYSDWKTSCTREERQSSSVRTETKTECAKTTYEPISREKPCGLRRWGLVGPHDHHKKIKIGEKPVHHMEELQREVRTDFDGHVTYGDWRVIRQWTN